MKENWNNKKEKKNFFFFWVKKIGSKKN